ncbi:MAG: hypothetical protein KDC05_14980 [Bacteroidales bacterium]|nr:hypothetical protein [Bacteroidales bacterium]
MYLNEKYFGTFSASLTTTPSDSPEKVSRFNIQKLNVQFRAAPMLKDALKNAKFEKK